MVTGRKMRVVEIVGGIMVHAELLHDPLRGKIGCSGERHDLVEAEYPEAVVDHGLCRFSGYTLVPIDAGEAPPDLVGGSERCVERGRVEPDESGERDGGLDLDSPESPTALSEPGGDAIDERRRSRLGRGRRESAP